MNRFETMDNMNTNFVALSEQELMEMEGGIAPAVVAFGIAAFKGFSVTGGVIVLGTSLYNSFR